MIRTVFGATLLALAIWAPGGASAAPRTVTLVVEGMTCASCPYIVRGALAAVPGVVDVAVSYEEKTAVVTFDDGAADVEALTAATADVGFPSRPAETREE